MARLFNEDILVIASHNVGKIDEIAELFSNWDIQTVSAVELKLPQPTETGDTFIANAILKAQAAANDSGLAAIADDSGLEVQALAGAPGIYSARWAGQNRDFGLAMSRVQEKLGNSTNRRARFVCALALAWPDGHSEVFDGRVSGHLIWPPRGNKGFGYDPMFVADGHHATFAEIDPMEKHSKSHRALAFSQLTSACFGKKI